MQASRRRAVGFVAIALVAAAMVLAVLLSDRRSASAPAAIAQGELQDEQVAAPPPLASVPVAREPEASPIPSFVLVSDAGTGAPLEGALIELLDPKGNGIGKQVTDAEGRVDFLGGVPPPGGVLCRCPGYRLAGRCDLLADHELRLEPVRTLTVELARVPDWLDAWVLEAELRYPRRIAAAMAIGNHVAWTRIGDCSARAPIDTHLARLPIEIESQRELAILGRPSNDAPSEEIACVSLKMSQDRVVVDLRHVRKRGKVWTLRGTVELPVGHSLQSVRIRRDAEKGATEEVAAGAIESATTFTATPLEEGDYSIELEVAGGARTEPWRLLLGPQHVAADIARHWVVDLQPQARVRVIGADEATADALSIQRSEERVEHAVRRVDKGRFEVAGLAAGTYEIAYQRRWMEGESFVVEAGGPIDVVLDARTRTIVAVKIDAGESKETGSIQFGQVQPPHFKMHVGELQVRDLEAGRWLERLRRTVARDERLQLPLLPGRYLVQASFADRILDASVIVPESKTEPITVRLR